MPRIVVAVAFLAALLGRPLEAGDEHRLCPPPPSPALDETPSGAPALPLAWLDVTGSGRQAQGVAQSEARAILQAMGLRPTWRRARAEEPARPHEIRVVLIDRLLVDRESGEPVLGATPAGTRIYPVVWIHVPGVRLTLRLGSNRDGAPLPARDRRALGVALGRVIAHEVVHAVAPSLAHGHGLMSRALTRRELIAPSISFEPGVGLVMRAAMRGVPAPTPATPAVPGVLAAAGSVSPELRRPAGPGAEGFGVGGLLPDDGLPR